jgi:RAB6A-GEF complex partner protein 1
MADRIEFCWIHLRGVGALENSLWGYDGEALRIWLDALTISSQAEASLYATSVVENVRLPLEFYPLCESLEDFSRAR